MTTIYVRKFDETIVKESDTDKYPPSKYFPKAMVNALKRGLSDKGYIRSDDYIIGPLYKKEISSLE